MARRAVGRGGLRTGALSPCQSSSFLAAATLSAVGCQSICVVATPAGRMCGVGSRWHSRHQPMLSGST